MPITATEIRPGTRVAYEDAANPRRTGTVTDSCGADQYRVAWDFDDDDAPCIACGASGAHEYGCVVGETITDLRQTGWVELADMPGSPFDGADIVSRYMRADAIRDGVLVPTSDLVPDEPDFARSAGFVVPVALTSAVAALVVPTEWETARHQDVKGRLWDVLSMARLYARRTAADESLFPCIFVLGTASERHISRAGRKTLTLKTVVSGGDDGEPVITISLPHED